MKKNLALLLVLPFALPAETLPELIELSKQNKMIDASKKNLESTILEYDSVRASYLPNFSVGASYQQTNKETVSTPDNTNRIYASVDYTIYDGNKRENTFDSYTTAIKSEKESLNNIENKTALEVVNFYYAYLSLQSQKEAKLKEIEQLNAQQERLKHFVEVGSATHDELQKIISRVASANVALHEIELNIQTIIHNLEYTVGKSVTIQKGSSVKEYHSKEQTLRSDIKALEYSMQTMLYNAKVQKSGYYPTLSFNDTYYSNDLNYKNASLGAMSDNYEQNILSLNMSWSIFNFGSTTNAYDSVYKKYLATKSQYEYEKNKAGVDLKLAYKAYDIAQLKIDSAKAALEAANSAYEAIKAKFENGLVDNVAYLEALSEKYLAQSALNTAVYDLEVKKANIIYHSGKNLEEFIK